MSELHRTLDEDVFYPPHDPRTASKTYRVTHDHLVNVLDSPCWICGIRKSDVLKLPKAEQQAHQLETHHAHFEWASQFGLDLDLVTRDWPDLGDRAKLAEWVDSEGNMLVLCAKHHRGSRTGIHSITYPAWLLQRYQGKEFTFIVQDAGPGPMVPA